MDPQKTGQPRGSRFLNRTVTGAGLTSALGDLCYETTTVIQPGFLAVLGVPAALLGLVEGVADATASFTKLAAGYIGDKLGHRKLLVVIGYGLTPSLGVVKAAQIAGLCYVGRNVVQVVASYPVGVLADRIGARRVLGGGYVLGVLTAVSTTLMFYLTPGNFWLIGVVFVLAGLYMAVQEALEATVTAELVSPGIRATGFGAIATVNGAAKFISSAAVGLLWSAVSPVFGFGLAAVFMAAGTIALVKLRKG